MLRNRLSLLLVLGVLTSCATVGPTATPRQTPAASITPHLPADTIAGQVVDASGPVAGATVRVKATDNATTTAADGTFVLDDVSSPATITAWAEGYFVAWQEDVPPGAPPIHISLAPYYQTDNPDYGWFSTEEAAGSLSCAHCMPACEEWVHDAHAQAAVNPRFLTMYNGTDIDGNQSPPTRYITNRDYGQIPLPPDADQPYYGPGYRLDFPSAAGNCATCHAPAAASTPASAHMANINELEGIEEEGIFCEFCHKVGEVALNPQTMLPYSNRPGTLSLSLYRPEEGAQLFFGTHDDVTRRVSRLPLMQESAFCAPCHYGVFWDTVIYNSYGEWLDSPYSHPETGKTCQDCHMPPTDYDYFVYPEQGGFVRTYDQINSHLMPGAADETLLQNTVTMVVDTSRQGEEVVVTVAITNDQAGHHVPTDSPLRHLILLVEAVGESGDTLPQIGGPRVPDWGGIGDPAEGYYAGQPGTAYAKILQELWTETTPTAAYWNMTRIVSDNRIAAYATDTTHYTFSGAVGEKATVRVRLLFRRAFIELADQKGWDDPDIVMEETTFRIP